MVYKKLFSSAIILASLLLQHAQASFDVNATVGEEKITPLIYRCVQGDIKMVAHYLSLGADVNAKDKNGMTALMYAVLFDNYPMVELLIQNGAAINEKDNAHATALMFVRNVKMGKLLLKHGARVNETDCQGKTVLMCVVNPNVSQDDSANLLFIFDDNNIPIQKVVSLLKSTIAEELSLIVKLLVDHGADVNSRDNKGFTALMHAIDRGVYDEQVAVVECLIRLGAEVNGSSNEGNAYDILMKTYSENKGAIKKMIRLLWLYGSPAMKEYIAKNPPQITPEDCDCDCDDDEDEEDEESVKLQAWNEFMHPNYGKKVAMVVSTAALAVGLKYLSGKSSMEIVSSFYGLMRWIVS